MIGDWASGSYLDPKTGRVFTDSSWFFPTQIAQRNGVQNHFSNFWKFDCAADAFDNTQPVFSPSKFTIVNRGYCGSTCACFVDLARLHSNVRVVGLPTHDASSIMAASFPGGNVVDSATIMATLQNFKDDALTTEQKSGLEKAVNASYGLGEPPGPFACVDCFRLPISEIFGFNNLSMPLEYRFVPPTTTYELTRSEAFVFGSYWQSLA